MGYYKGNGVVSGGNESISTLGTYIFPNGTHKIIQKIVSVVTKRSGVSLDSAQAVHAEHSMSAVGDYYQAWTTTGGVTFYKEVRFPDAKGRRVKPSYSQIGDSNLYELTINEETVLAQIDNRGWQS